jgi:hypothetical protein
MTMEHQFGFFPSATLRAELVISDLFFSTILSSDETGKADVFPLTRIDLNCLHWPGFIAVLTHLEAVL